MESKNIIGVNVEENQKSHVDRSYVSKYTTVFDKTCPAWDCNQEYNLLFLRAIERYANDLVRCRSDVKLWEICRWLQLQNPVWSGDDDGDDDVGWKLEDSDDFYIDFGIPLSIDGSPIVLDFNVNWNYSKDKAL